jgi:branched-chain amino acid transport system substrate-binding protein
MRLGKVFAVSAAAVLAASALMLGGCSSGGSSAGGAGSSGAATELHIGIGAPLTAGSVAQGQGIQRGVELAIALANESAEAKAAGVKFVGIPGDDQGDPKTGVTVANTFASDRQLVGVVGHLNSGVTIPASKVYAQAKDVMISPAATNPAVTLQGLKNIFRVCTIDSVQGPTGADAAYNKFGFKTAVVIDDSTPYGTGLAEEFGKQFTADGGKILFTEKTSDKDNDFSALVTKLKAQNPDVVYYGGVYNAGALLSKQMKDAAVKAPMMGGDGLFDPQFIALAGKADGDLCTSVGLPTDKLPKAQEFQAAYAKQFPGKEIGAYDAYSYDAANVIIASILKVAKEQGAAKVTSPAGRDAIIADVAATSTDGVTGKISFDSNGDTTNKAITVYKVENGKWVAAVIPGE